ncbi:lysine-rich arabinogalactan protein 18-like [Humulus lupulus]|uniref:lysine-rich arabinogalactan protein 18-like n=1 Tax=Humulus lupulus TaxID=3486 RepID=UPI002B402515|nr:lysine-rich arabinogalactan protein 18-like [Humulus lupulus]
MKVDEFINLTQNRSTVTKYAIKYDRLAKFAPDLVPTDAARKDRYLHLYCPHVCFYIAVMLAEDQFDLYSEPDTVAPASNKKGSRQPRGESSSNTPTKKAQTRDPPALVPSRETTPPPAPINQSSPLAPIDQTRPPAPANPTPPPPADQTPPDQI